MPDIVVQAFAEGFTLGIFAGLMAGGAYSVVGFMRTILGPR